MCIDRVFRCQRGFSLIELVVFIVVISIAVTGILAVMAQSTAHSTDPMVRRQLLALADSLLEEISEKPYTWCDPDDANLVTAASVAGCASTAEAIGAESGETRYGPTFFDNVNDYDGFSMTGIRALDGTVIGGLESYQASVSVSVAGTAFGLADASAALAVVVTVSGYGQQLSLTSYRFRHSPNSGG